MYILTFIYKQKILKKNGTEQNTCRVESVYLAEIICNNLLPLCNRETLVYDLRNVPRTFAQIIEVRIDHQQKTEAECAKHADCLAQFKLCW